MTQRIRVGVIGCGLIAQVMHLPYLRELRDRFEIAALCDASPGTLAGVAEEFGVGSCFTDWRELLAQPLEAVLILTGGSHAPLALAALERRLHVFVEKPMCFTLPEADAMIAAEAAAGTTLFIGNMKRYDPAFEATRRELERLTNLTYVRVTTLEAPLERYVAHYPLVRGAGLDRTVVERQRQQGLVLAREALGPSASHELLTAYLDLLLDSAVHELNLLRAFLGDPTAVLNASFWDEGRSMQATLEFGAKVRAVISLVWLSELRRYEQEFAFFSADRRVAMEFPSPFLRSEPTRVIVDEEANEATWRREGIVSYEEAFRLELEAFHDCIVGKSSPRTSGREGRRDVQLAQTIAVAARDGRRTEFAAEVDRGQL